MFANVFCAQDARPVVVETLEGRRMFAVDLAWGPITVQGNLFLPNQSTNIIANVRNVSFQAIAANALSVEFRYVDVGFRTDAAKVNFYDPAAVTLTTTPVTVPVPGGAAGVTMTFPLTFPATLAPSRYVLLARLDSTNAVSEMSEENNVTAVGTARVLPPDGNLAVSGTDGADRIGVAAGAKTSTGAAAYRVTVGAYSEVFSASAIKAFTVTGKAGDDVISAAGAVPGLVVDGGDGNDKIIGGSGNDVLSGGAGKDYIDGASGNDRLNGNGGNDRLLGGAGSDRLYGFTGNDYLDGGSSGDRLDGGAGPDILIGGSGNDKFSAKDNEKDQLIGGSGSDGGDADPTDLLSSVTRKA
ncbi:MAG TPA: calcium-binding protein [Tepidisphaeraceae bacterium]|jgi:Ca2+-binding RTX toxin-like protein